MNNRNHRAAAVAAMNVHYLACVAVVRKAIQYVSAANRDERINFPFTAAWEWREAAELFGSSDSAADYCWRQWERIMHLPRHLAAPILECE